jgi:tripartite-type tricarboxylate transporter receptor subunit TctC
MTIRLLGLLFLTLAWPIAHAQSDAYPGKLVRIIVPFPGGGTADAVTRIVAEKLSARWGQPVIIDNRPGAGGNIGAEQFSRSEPDGYTLMSSPPGPIAVNDSLHKSLRYDPAKFVSISLLATSVSVLVVRPNLQADTVKDLVKLAKEAPRKLSFASQGNGSTSHLTAAMFQQQAGVEMLHVPYKSSPAALTDVMGGQIDVFFDNISSSIAQHRAGKIRILAVAGPNRSPALPELPTISEAGLPGFQSVSWNALVGPAGLPAPVAQKISATVAEALRMPDVRDRYAKLSADPVGSTPDEADRFITDERTRWKKVIKDANVSVD